MAAVNFFKFFGELGSGSASKVEIVVELLKALASVLARGLKLLGSKPSVESEASLIKE